MMKLTGHLYRWNPDPRYFDYFERKLLNERIGTIRPENGCTQYYRARPHGCGAPPRSGRVRDEAE
jgi:DUF1680 family protein